jgi:hypothetical protein
MVDFEADAAVRKAGWDSFTKFVTYSSVAIVITLVLMALFLL